MKSIASFVAVSALVAANAFAGPARVSADPPVTTRAEALSITHNMTLDGSATDLSLAQAPARLGPLRRFTTNGPTNLFDSTDDTSGADTSFTEQAVEPAVAEAPSGFAAAPPVTEIFTVPVVAETSAVFVAAPGADIASSELAIAPVVSESPTLVVAARLETSPAAVPEPGTVALLGLGLVGCAIVRRSRAGRP